MNCRLLCALLVAFGISGRSVSLESPEESKNCMTLSLEESIQRSKECIKKGQVANYINFMCYDLNSEGGCGEGQRRVLIKGNNCAETKCINNKVNETIPCRDGEIAYEGKCLKDGDRNVCLKAGRGRALHADLYGGVSCDCAVHYGFLEMDGECYPEYLQGKCPEGKHVRRMDGSFKGECMKHSCSEGKYSIEHEQNEIFWPNYQFYQKFRFVLNEYEYSFSVKLKPK